MERKELVQITRRKKISESEFVPASNSMQEQIWLSALPMQIGTQGLSPTVSGNVVTPVGTPVPDCISCGACCAAFVLVAAPPDNGVPDDNCWLITDDVAGSEITVDRFVRRRESDFACAMLAGEVGDRVSCTVYEDRPTMCRIFEAGSDRCHAVRRAFGLEPFLSLTEMSEARAKLDLPRREDVPAKRKIRSVSFVADGHGGPVNIEADLNDGSRVSVFAFDPEKEKFFKAQFEGLTVSEARALKT